MKLLPISKCFLLIISFNLITFFSFAQDTRLLRQPDINDTHITYTYGSDIWVSKLDSNESLRITSTAALEANPHFSPDGKWIAFNSNRSGFHAVYIVSVKGGEAKKITWHPSGASVRGWTNDGKQILYASSRETAPSPYNRLWTISKDGGAPKLLTSQWSYNGAFSPNGKKMIIDKMSRWDVEWRAYRGGQNTPLIILNLDTQDEELLPNDSTTDIKPIWLANKIYFLSDRDLVSNIWSFEPKTKTLKQVTKFKGSDVKWLAGHNNTLAYERDGYLHTMDIASKKSTQLEINVLS